MIPTRERAATLGHALRSCLDQQFEDYEIVVADNASSPATRALVDEIAAPRVRYFRTPGPLAMAANWEFAVAQARGEYVIVIGDDDALLPHALAELDTLTSETRPKAVRWEPAFFTWPTFPLAGQGSYLRIPLGRGVREVEGMIAVREVIAFREPPGHLPSIYHAHWHDVPESAPRPGGYSRTASQPSMPASPSQRSPDASHLWNLR